MEIDAIDEADGKVDPFARLLKPQDLNADLDLDSIISSEALSDNDKSAQSELASAKAGHFEAQINFGSNQLARLYKIPQLLKGGCTFAMWLIC